MTIEFDPTERRIVGVLIEKALATPEYYPMTVNALVAACNQRSNRHPVTDYQEFEIEGALRSLFEKKWITYVEGGGRARKWRHRLDERLGLTPPELAVVAELLLRGPQQPGELKARCARMANIPTQEVLTAILESLGNRLPPLVVKLSRERGERADRFGQTLASDGSDAAPGASQAPTPPSPADAPAHPREDAGRTVLERLDALERAVAEMRAEIDAHKRG